MEIATDSIIILNRVDSTNNYAMGLLRNNAAGHGLSVFAREQTAGKGRRGKTWKSSRNENIMMSIAIDTRHLSLHHQFKISVIAALATFDLFEKYYTENLKIKWPNDLFCNDRKAAGILIENIIKGELWQWSVIGIGINVNQTSFNELSNEPTSLKLLTGKNYDVIELAIQLKKNILERCNELKDGFEKMLGEYNQKLYRLNETVKLKKGNIVFETLIKGVSTRGQLITVDAIEKRFVFDEVEWLRDKGVE